MNLFVLMHCDDDGSGWYECNPLGIFTTYEEATEEKNRLLAPCDEWRNKQIEIREENEKMVAEFLERNRDAIACHVCQNKKEKVDKIIDSIVKTVYYNWPREGEEASNQYRNGPDRLMKELLKEEVPLLPKQDMEYPRPFYHESGFQINEVPFAGCVSIERIHDAPSNPQ